MERFFTYALCAATVALASCSQDETFEQVNLCSNVISFRASLPQDGPMTKADASVKRYVMGLYKGTSGTDKVDLTPNDENNATISQTDGTFELDGETFGLETGVTYTAVFWADYDDGAYNVNDLHWVALNSDKNVSMAYAGKKEFTYGEALADNSVILKRVVAQVNLNQKTAYTANEGDKITVSYTGNSVYDVMAADIASGDGGDRNYEFEIAVPAGEKAEDSTLGLFYAFPSSNLTTITFAYNDGEPISVSNVPLTANYQTGITGNYTQTNSGYTFEVDTDNGEWGNQNVDMSDEEGSGETGEEEGGEEQPAEDKTAPTAIVTASVSGTTISYEFVITDETQLGTSAEIKLQNIAGDGSWKQVGETRTVELQLGEDSKSAIVSGTFESLTAGSYIVDIKTWDAKGNELYYHTGMGNITLTVQ